MKSLIVLVLFSKTIYSTEINNDLVKIIPAFYARSMCSCLFVSGVDEVNCFKANKMNPEPDTLVYDYDAKTVSSSFYGFQNIARFVSKKDGCLLD